MTTQSTIQPLSPDQKEAHDAVIKWWQAAGSVEQTLTLGGFAGTGKTTTIAQIVATIHAEGLAAGEKHRARIAFCCFTGKASLILRTKLERAEVLTGDDYCGTIHGLIYMPQKGPNGKIKWVKNTALEADLIILDEASMVDEVIFQDLAGYGIPILAVGDHGQLPPIAGSLNLMSKPVIRLEKIHRQAEGNPIVQMSLRAREGKAILCGEYGTVRKVSRKPVEQIVEKYASDFDAAGMVLCGTNATRSALNRILRARKGFTSDLPMIGERVICLRNRRAVGLFNGLTGELKEITPYENELYAQATVALDTGEEWSGVLRLDQFGAAKTIQVFEQSTELFDWGYALTVHKAQGSEAPGVVVFEECGWMETEDLRRRWRYTAYTRAAERLLIVG